MSVNKKVTVPVGNFGVSFVMWNNYAQGKHVVNGGK
jgi:hypothetical protein